MKSYPLVIISFVSFVAIIGLILFFKASGTGMGIYIRPGRAMATISEDRFYSPGVPETGILAKSTERKGRDPYSNAMGYEPCPKDYSLERLNTYKTGCIPVKYPNYYIGRICCPIVQI